MTSLSTDISLMADRVQILGLADQTTDIAIPMYLERISAGFSSYADDHIAGLVDVHDYLVRHPVSTFLVRFDGDSMKGAGILAGDILVVDKSELPEPGKLVVFVLNGRLTLRRMVKRQNQFQLVAENQKFMPIVVPNLSTFEAWGVVVGIARKL